MFNLTKLEDILRQEVTRKEFLRYVGVTLLGVIGITRMIQQLQTTTVTHRQEHKAPVGYGASSYGR